MAQQHPKGLQQMRKDYMKIFDLNVKKFSHELRDFRNYIHPNEQLKNQFSPNIDTAKIGFQVLKAAVSQINTFIHDSAE